MELTPSGSTLGAVVTGVDLTSPIDGDTARFLRQSLDDRGVLVIPRQAVDDAAQQRVASVWAPPQPHPVVEYLGGDDVIGVVFNDAEHLPPEGSLDTAFHTDYSFNPEIPDVAVLRATIIPPVGGNTGWADTRAALPAVAADLMKDLGCLVAHHDMGPRFHIEMQARFGDEIADRLQARFGPGFRHPVVTRHPRTGDPLLFVNPAYTRYIIGLSAARSDALLDRLFATFADPAIQFEHQWTPDDLVVWDEHRTVHRGPNDFAPHSRELRRCTAGRRVPVAAAA